MSDNLKIEWIRMQSQIRAPFKVPKGCTSIRWTDGTGIPRAKDVTEGDEFILEADIEYDFVDAKDRPRPAFNN